MEQILYGLIGYPLDHSRSEALFEAKFKSELIANAEYRNFPIEQIAQLPELLKEYRNLAGLNVTRPYKESVMSHLTQVDDQALIIGAVNCIKIRGNNLIGYNTDVYGFRTSLLKFIGGNRPDAVVLGSGGAARAVKFVLEELGIDYLVVSRRKHKAHISYEQLTSSVIESHKLIINATPLGMSPDIDRYPTLPYDSITKKHLLYDLIYNPAESAFLRLGRERGARTMNGEAMFLGQAKRSWEIWQSDRL